MIFVGITYGLAVVAAVLLALHVWRRYPAMPARVPLHIGLDGRPGTPYPKAWIWFIPATFAIVIVLVGIGLLTSPPQPQDRFVLTLVFLEIALVAYLMGWVVDRLVELARRQTYRIAPIRIGLVVAAIVAPILLILFVARLAGS